MGIGSIAGSQSTERERGGLDWTLEAACMERLKCLAQLHDWDFYGTLGTYRYWQLPDTGTGRQRQERCRSSLT